MVEYLVIKYVPIIFDLLVLYVFLFNRVIVVVIFE